MSCKYDTNLIQVRRGVLDIMVIRAFSYNNIITPKRRGRPVNGRPRMHLKS